MGKCIWPRVFESLGNCVVKTKLIYEGIGSKKLYIMVELQTEGIWKKHWESLKAILQFMRFCQQVNMHGITMLALSLLLQPWTASSYYRKVIALKTNNQTSKN